MTLSQLNSETLDRIRELVEANFAGRSELKAAAESLDDDARQRVCRRLAGCLEEHAAELRQIMADCGAEPAGPLDLEPIASALFDLAKSNRGDRGVIQAAAEGEGHLKKDYDRAIDAVSNQDVEDLLKRQREEIELVEQVLRGLEDPNAKVAPKVGPNE